MSKILISEICQFQMDSKTKNYKVKKVSIKNFNTFNKLFKTKTIKSFYLRKMSKFKIQNFLTGQIQLRFQKIIQNVVKWLMNQIVKMIQLILDLGPNQQFLIQKLGNNHLIQNNKNQNHKTQIIKKTLKNLKMNLILRIPLANNIWIKMKMKKILMMNFFLIVQKTILEVHNWVATNKIYHSQLVLEAKLVIVHKI